MTYERDRLPDPLSFYENEGLRLIGPRSAKWKTTKCQFHGGSDSMRINTNTGAWVCMSCDVKGGDVLSYHMQAHAMEFIEAATALGAWSGVPPSSPNTRRSPPPLPPRAALEVLSFEATLTAVAALNIFNRVQLSELDLQRLLLAANRINRLVEAYQ